jgi:hypothetical protein
MPHLKLQQHFITALTHQVEHVAVETLWKAGPFTTCDLRYLECQRSYVWALREDPRLQPVRDLYTHLRQYGGDALALEDGVQIDPRTVFRAVCKHLYVAPSEAFGHLIAHPRVNFVTAFLRAGTLLRELADREPDGLRMESLYHQAAQFFGAGALWAKEGIAAGTLRREDISPENQQLLSTLKAYIPWLHMPQPAGALVRTDGEMEEVQQADANRQRQERNLHLMPESLRQFFEGSSGAER